MTARCSLGLIMLDIDHFKFFNDRFGHRTGDAVLRAVAHCIPASCRSVDVVARYGGEEFAVILPNVDRLIAAGICVSVRRAVEDKRIEFEGISHRVTVSLGAAVLLCPAPPSNPRTLIEAADRQLYRSKDKGRNRCSMIQLPSLPVANLTPAS